MADNASNVHQAKPRSPSFSSVHVEIVNRRDDMNGFNQLWIGSRSSMPAIGDCASSWFSSADPKRRNAALLKPDKLDSFPTASTLCVSWQDHETRDNRRRNSVPAGVFSGYDPRLEVVIINRR